MCIRRKSVNDGATISKKMNRTIDEGAETRKRRARRSSRPITESALDVNTNEIRRNARDDRRTESPTENQRFKARNP